MILAFVIGFVWMVLLALQTKAIAKEASPLRIAVLVFFAALVFGLTARTVALSALTIPPYSVGCALGAYISTRIRV